MGVGDAGVCAVVAGPESLPALKHRPRLRHSRLVGNCSGMVPGSVSAKYDDRAAGLQRISAGSWSKAVARTMPLSVTARPQSFLQGARVPAWVAPKLSCCTPRHFKQCCHRCLHGGRLSQPGKRA